MHYMSNIFINEKYLLLDLGGTIIDIKEEFEVYTKNGIEKLYYKVNPNIHKNYFCDTMLEIRNRIRYLAKSRDIEFDFRYFIDYSFKKLKIRTDNISIRELENLYVKEELKISDIFPDVIDFLKNAKKKKKILIATTNNFSSLLVNMLLEKFYIKKYFNYIFISGDIGLRKPNVNFLNELSTKYKLSLNYTNTIIFGDSVNDDIKCGIRKKIKTCHVIRKKRDEILYVEKPNYCINNFNKVCLV